MSRIASPLPLACGTFGLLLFMGSAQAALSRFANAPIEPPSAADSQLLRCGDAVRLFDQGHAQEAVVLMRKQAHQPMPLPTETPIPITFTPAAQVLRLSQQMCCAAKKADAMGYSSRAQAYIAECYVLGKRIRSTEQSNPQLSLQVARFVERAAQRAEAALENPVTR